MSRLDVSDTPIPGLRLVRAQRLGDARGHLARLFCAEELRLAGWSAPMAQVNLTLTRQRGTVRGLHYQRPPDAEIKLVRCLRGAVWDVVVDLRSGSPTFLQWHAEVLSADNLASLLIPQGCAHGFQALSDDVEMLYMHSAPYVPASEGGVSASEPRLAIPWPLPITEMSGRDLAFPLLTKSFEGIALT
jgi:dTDP-4-dehydrorhamnose 3,5-epimerase